MDQIIHFILQHQTVAPWLIFVLILLAGINIPISIDILLILSAFLASNIIPEVKYLLYFTFLIGTWLSAQIAYFLGRKIGIRFVDLPLLKKVLSKAKIERVNRFYQNYGLWTLLIGRFIPFGIRNAIFISSGISRTSYLRFIRQDALACIVWVTSCFYLFYRLGAHYQIMLQHLKMINLIIFFSFGVTVITTIWYKKRKKKISTTQQK